MTRFLMIAVLALGALPATLLAWGQCTHGCISFDLLEAHAATLPKVCSDDATRNTYLHASYSPDMYVLQGPEYVHLDRQFALLLFKHAKTARQLAIAYGWSTHQEEDSVGHGRYITEVGLPHMYKELVMDSRFLFQGSRGESDTVKGLGAAWDADQINAASQDYTAKYGAKYPVISPAMANTTGYVFSAYITAVKGVLYALWYGRVKWHKELYPRSEWQGYVGEAVEQANKWCMDPFSFAGSSQELNAAAQFTGLFKTPTVGDEVQAVREEAPLVPQEQTLSNIAAAVGLFSENRSKMPVVSAFGTRLQSEGGASHIMLQNDTFVKLGQKLLGSNAIQIEERTEGGFHQIRTRIKSKKKFMVDLARTLKETGMVATQDARIAPGAGGSVNDFFSGLSKDADQAANDAPEEPEN